MTGKRALVIGGSLGGLIAAHLLRQAGWDAVVLERNGRDLESRGAGVGTHPALIDILRRIDPALGDTIGVEVGKVICLAPEGGTVLERATSRTMSAWSHLYASLRRRLPAEGYRLGKSLQRLEQDRDGVTANFADGSHERGDLLVGADGLRSTVREQLFPAAMPVYAGYIAWRIMLDEAAFPPAIRDQLFDTYAFCLPEGEQLLGYPVPGRNDDTRAGQRAYNIVWYRPVEPTSELVDISTDASGRHHPAGIPPPLIRPDVIARLVADAHRLVAPQLAAIVERASPVFQPIYDLESTAIASGRAVLVGDAAFVARPHLGAGVTKAALDAAGLVAALKACDGDMAAAVARYQRVQLPLGQAMVGLARQEGAYLGAQLKPPVERRPEERQRDFDATINSHETRRQQLSGLVDAWRARGGM